MTSLSPADDRLITTFGRLLEAANRLERRLDAAMQDESGLPQVWFEVLIRLARTEGGQLTMGTLAEEVVLTTSGITRLVDRIAAAGYIERRPCPTDRRVSYAAVTDAGLEAVERAAVAHARNLRKTFAGFDEDEIAQLDRLLDRLRERPA
ncbi:MarR family winged helix-turn-helix transcriptional regulator [Streptomyces tauricus]|uniref:MarR family winged helix-turn-helix transcriptional regulator n=1 Tax=Streptomyces tauricus TaxID=68274 RepID=UPI0033B01A6E